MRNIGRIFRDDVRYLKSNIVSVLVALGLCLVPVMYAWFNIVGSWDPYANTGQLKVAVANSDEGYRSDLVPVQVNVGQRVVEQLHENDEYGWVFVGEDDAVEGVRSGEYYAAIVIPADFSRKLMTVFTADAQQAQVDYYLNLKENPIAPVLAGEGGAEVMEDIRVQFTGAVDDIALGLASDIVSFADGDKMQSFGALLVTRLNTVAANLHGTAGQVRAFAGLADAASGLTAATASALRGSGDSADAAGGVVERVSSQLRSAIDSAREAAAALEAQLAGAAPAAGLDDVGDGSAARLVSDVRALADSAELVAVDAASLADSLNATVAGLAGSTGSLATDLDTVRSALNVAAGKLDSAGDAISGFEDDLSRALASGDLATVADLVGRNPGALASWMAAPVQVQKHVVYPVQNYGSSMAPFYTILSIWVGAVVLVAIMKTGVSQERLRRYERQGGRPVKNYEQYLGRYLVFLALNLAQATVVCLGDVFFLRVQCVSPLLFLVACWTCALVFSSIVYTFAVSFGEVGKALCIILLVMQVAGSGGEYPIQMMGDFFQAVYPFLPFTHGMHAMQAAIAGVYGMEYAASLACLLAFLIPSLFLGLVIRRPVIRFMSFFSAKLEETGIM